MQVSSSGVVTGSPSGTLSPHSAQWAAVTHIRDDHIDEASMHPVWSHTLPSRLLIATPRQASECCETRW